MRRRRATPVRGLVAVATAVFVQAAAGAEAVPPVVRPCHVAGIAGGVLCGSVRRPLDAGGAGGPSIDVAYVVVPAAARNRLPDPLFFLAGGPGQSATAVAGALMPLFSRLHNRRDIVFVDVRGTGRSAPLACEDAEDETLAAQSEPARRRAAVARCKARLLRLPYVAGEAALGAFTTPRIAADLDAVRAALGAARIDLVGVSYGTRVALEYQRRFPDRVRRSVLDGVAPPDMALPDSFGTDNEAAWRALLAACAAEPACAAAHPQLGARFAAFLRTLPREVRATHPVSGRDERFVLDRERLLGAVRAALYVPALAAALPEAVDAATRGDLRGLFGLESSLLGSRSTRVALGMHLSVICSEDLPRVARPGAVATADAVWPDRAAASVSTTRPIAATPGATAVPGATRPGLPATPPGATGSSAAATGAAEPADDLFGRASVATYERLCADWPRGPLPADFFALAPARTPVLILSGGLDPATPPRHGARAAAALGPAARHVVVANAGHGVLGVGCVRDLVFRFVDAASDTAALDVDARCVDGLPRPPAFVSRAAAAAAPR